MNQELQERKVTVENQEIMDIRVTWASLGFEEHPVSRDLLDLLVYLVKKDPMVRKENRGLLVRKDPEVCLEHQVWRVLWVRLDQEGCWGTRDPTGFLVFPDYQVSLDLKGVRVSVVIQVKRGGRDYLVYEDNLDFLVLWEREDLWG